MPRVDPDIILQDWQEATQGELLPKPKYVEIAERQAAEERELERQHWLDWTPDELAELAESFGQQRLEFEEDDKYANVNIHVARYLRDVVMPAFPLPLWEKWASKLLNARLTGCLRYNRETGKLIKISNDKAGLPLLDPADARDEYMRLQRRYLPTLLEWRNSGKALHWSVFTMPNFRRGELRKGMQEMFARYNRLIIESGKFPEIKGSMGTLEAPLSALGNWNVHLNVLMACDGFLEYEKLQREWGYGLKIGRVQVNPFKEESYESALRRSLLELFKYPVRAISEKSHAKANEVRRGSLRVGGCAGSDVAGGDERVPDDDAAADAPGFEAEYEPVRAPALTEYPPGAFVELVFAHRAFRRTRTRGVLYKVKKPEPESQAGFETVGKFYRRRGDSRTVWDIPLLFSIQGDKSAGDIDPEDIRAAVRKLKIDLLGPPDLLDRVREAQRTIEEHYGPVSLAVD